MLLAFAEGAIQLVPDATLLFHLVVIVVMVAILNVTLLRPINRILNEREQRTEVRLSEAASTLARVEKELREYELHLRDARAEGYALMEKARATLSGERERKLADVKAEIVREILDEHEKIRIESAGVRAKLAVDARIIGVEISRRILHRPAGGQLR